MRHEPVRTKPDHVFDRDREWAGLVSFVTNPHAGAMLGVVSGRPRQGKSFLLEALVSATGGLYLPALEETEAISLRAFASTLVRHGIPVSEPLRNWEDAIALLFSAVRDRPRAIVIDEFPFLVRASPSLPSIIQRELGPGGSGQRSTARLLLCGSAMAVMGQLLAGHAPLRGRASLELVVRPFEYLDAARFWGAQDPRLAVLLHAVVGGTPAYRRELVAFEAPAGNRTNGGIADYVGRRSAEITHPLAVLEDSALVAREADAFRPARSSYRVTEPLVTFYEAVLRPEWHRLEAGHGEAVWRDRRHDFFSRVVGPHFEELCRSFARQSAAEVFGSPAGLVGSGIVNDPARRSQIEVDVVVLAPPEPGRPRRLLSLGEAKWGEVMGRHHLARLARARDLLATRFDTSDCVLACYAAAGFDDDMRDAAGPRTALLTLDDLYRQA